jgi:hypothetical protein
MLDYQDRWPKVFAAQRRDIEFIRTVVPEAPFNEKVYLTILLDIFNKSGVASKGLSIRPVKAASAQVNFLRFVTADLGELALSIEKFKEAFDYLGGTETIKGKEIKRLDSLAVEPGSPHEHLELALWYSYQFNNKMAISIPADVAILPGLEIHRFDTTITGSYENIKRFVWMVQNARPHTIIVNWHLSPGTGTGESRPYTASMTLVTFADTNIPPKFDFYPDNPNMPDVDPLIKMLGIT